MYYFNYKLIEKLPSLLGITQSELISTMKVTVGTFYSWTEGNMSCLHLANLCNQFHLRVSSFLTLEEGPVISPRKSDYVVESEPWQPVEWKNESAGKLFGKGGLTGITKACAAAKLGYTSYQVFDHWAKAPTAARVRDLLNTLNIFHLDASMFFHDPNSAIPLPKWEPEVKHLAELVDERLKDYSDLQRRFVEKEKEVSSLRTEKDRLNRELLLLRQNKADRKETGARSGMIGEAPVAYGSPFGERGYVFHRELWRSLPTILDIQATDFSRSIGMANNTYYTRENILIDTLVKVCNLYRISISHFFLPKNEIPVVHDLGYYQMSPRMFHPIEDHMDRMKHLFGKLSVIDASLSDLRTVGGVGYSGLQSFAKSGGTGRVDTLCDICTQFNIPPYVFFEDSNRKRPAYSQSVNERLILNAIAQAKEVEELRATVIKMRKKLKDTGKDVGENEE